MVARLSGDAGNLSGVAIPLDGGVGSPPPFSSSDGSGDGGLLAALIFSMNGRVGERNLVLLDRDLEADAFMPPRNDVMHVIDLLDVPLGLLSVQCLLASLSTEPALCDP